MSGKKGFAAVRQLQARAQEKRGGNDKLPAPSGERPGDLASCARHWLESLRARNYAAGTLHERECHLRFFGVWAAERDLCRASEITRPILEAYQRWLSCYERPNGQKLGWSTQRQKLSNLKEWFAWLTRQNVLLHNPASELEMPRPERRLPAEPLTPAELEKLFAVPDLSDPLGLRDRAMLELFYSAGLRRLELARLGLTDLHLARGTLTVRLGKGKKDRVVPVGARAAAWLNRYLEEVRPRLLLRVGEQAVFLTGYGEAFNPDVLTRMVSTWLKKAGIARKGSCHLLRHTCATHMLEGGADIRFIQQLLGHEKLDTTAIYTEVTIRQLLEVHTRCHPSGATQAAK